MNRRGVTLAECLTAIAVLSVVLTVVLRLIFVSDRALDGIGRQGQATAAAARLWEDLTRDLRGADGVAATASEVRISGTPPAHYTWSEVEQATVRQVAGELDRRYPGARAAVQRRGRLVGLRVTSGANELATTILARR